MSTPAPPPISQATPAVPAVGAGLPPAVAALLAAATAAAAKPGMSKAVIVGGVSVSGLAVYIADRLLADDGQLAASMLTKLSPLLGPVWASWPVIFILACTAVAGFVKWEASQKARTAADIAAALSAADLSQKVTAVAVSFDTGIAGLRAELHTGLDGVRRDLREHSETTDTRLRAVQTEVTAVVRRVDILEASPVKRRAPRR